VKKVRAPVKAAGFKIAKAVLWNEDGTVFEQDEEDDEKLGAEAPATGVRSAPPNGPAKPATPGEPKAVSPESAAFSARLKALVALIAAAGDSAAGKQAKLLGSEAGMHSRKEDWARVDALMTQAEALLGVVKVAGSAAPRATPSGTPAAEDAPMARGTGKAPPVNPALAFRSRLMELTPRMKPVEAAGGPVADQIKAKREEAVELVRQKGFTAEQLAQALALLDEVEALIAESGTAATAGSAPKVAAATGTNVVFQQTRLAWDATRKTIQAEVKKLEDSILASCQEDEEVGTDAVDLTQLSSILEKLDSRLIDKLDEALNAQDPAERQRVHLQAKGIVSEYMAFVNDSPLMADIDDSGFTPVAVRKTALSALTLLSSKL
jgi:hypothetical protein